MLITREIMLYLNVLLNVYQENKYNFARNVSKVPCIFHERDALRRHLFHTHGGRSDSL